MDWEHTLSQHGVPYATRGPNVARGAIAVKCPFCGPADPSEHLVIDLGGKGWLCRRSREHRGRSATRLLQALLGCTREQAQRLSGERSIPDDMLSIVRARLGLDLPAAVQMRKPPNMPAGFKRFTGLPSSRPFVHYLAGRGFDDRQIRDMIDRYDLRYCVRGSFGGRVIFPIKRDGTLVSWTGRSISAGARLRYKTLPEDPDAARDLDCDPAVAPISHYLLWEDELRATEADTVSISEGPFDALRVALLGRELGVCGTCVFTAEPSDEQVGLLHEILPRFKRRLLLLDQSTVNATMRISAALAGLSVEPVYLPAGLKDPGEIRSTKDLAQVLSI